MALFRYLKRKDGLPDPKGSLSLAIPSQTISIAKRKVTEAKTGDKKLPRALQEVQPGGGVLDRLLCLREDRTPTEADQNVPRMQQAHSYVSIFIHTKLVTI